MGLRFIEDGNFTAWVRGVFVFGGIGILSIGVGTTWLWPWFRLSLFLIGFLLAGIGGYAAQAHTLRLKPFDKYSYGKARKTYQLGDEHVK
ncbi:UNVERIFIED_ORG: hypothetical protein J2Y81_004316 [Paraburkholderia sediminicola]|nr:hypothetical protein [Paraburkholderia sediminicola]